MDDLEFWKERFDSLQDEVREMEKSCKETHCEVNKDFARTIESIHVLAREVNGKMTRVHESITELKVGNERNQNKQKFYVITVLVTVIIMLISSFAGFVYNYVERKDEVIKATNISKSEHEFRSKVEHFIENHEKQEKKF